MAYQDVKVPRFWINLVDYLSLNGILEIGDIFRTLPVNSIPFSGDESIEGLQGFTEQSFVAVLGHDSASKGVTMNVSRYYAGTALDLENIINATTGNHLTPQYDGFSIATFDGINENNFRFTPQGTLNIGSVLFGTYFDLPHSPDLSLTLEYQTGTKTIETRGGASLSNTMWRPPMWGDTLGAWELNDPSNETTGQALAHSSRRVWNLSFSYLDKKSTFPKYNALNRYANNEGLSESDLLLTNDETLLDSDDFFSRVFNIVGTSLPFIFQPDKDTFEFAICKFENRFSFAQVANGAYNAKLKIREVW